MKDPSLQVISTASVPIFGASFAEAFPIDPKSNPHSESVYSTDDNISPHSRFRYASYYYRGMTMNIKERRGKKVFIAPKLFIDEHTKIS